jgi:predicted porin
MQKKLLTVAVASALAVPAIAVAQSTTEVYGTVNMAFGQFRYTDGSGSQNSGATTVGASASKWDVANGASNYGVRSRENLGGGLSGWVQIEQNAPLERSSNQAIKPASRNSAVGLQGGFGNFFMGQWTTPWADLDALWGIGTVGFWGPVTSIIGRRETTGTAPNPNCINADGATPGGTTSGVGTVTCDALEGGGGVGHAFWRRASNAIFYQSPVMAGVQVKLAYQTNEGKATANTPSGATQGTNANPWLMSGSVQWAGMGGRARIGAAYDKHADFTAIGTTDNGYSVKGGWNFGVVDVGFAYEAMTYKPLAGDVKAKQYGLALAVPVGPGSIRASYSVAKDLSGTGIGTLTDTGAKQYNIGYEHRFSKRTNVGIGYAKIDNKSNAQFTWTGAPPNQLQSAAIPTNTPLFGSDVSTFFISMTHRF